MGRPYGWYSQNLQDYSTGFAAIFDVLTSTNRSQEILTMLSDGHYLDDQTASKRLSLALQTRHLAGQIDLSTSGTWRPSILLLCLQACS